MNKKRQLLAALILTYLFCFSLLNCSKQEQTQSRLVKEEQKSLVESQGYSSGGGENQSSNTDESSSSTVQDSLAAAFEPVLAPFALIHKDSLKHYSKAFVRRAYFKIGYSRESQEDFSISYKDLVHHEFFLNLPDKQLLFAKHWWYGGGDTPTGIVTFWQPKGERLQFIPLAGTSYLDFYADPTIADSMSYDDGALVLVLNSWTGDGGDIWGYYDILRFQKNKPIKLLSHEDYEYNNYDYAYDEAAVEDSTADYTTLKCEIVREEKTELKIRYIHDSFAIMQRKEHRLVKSDTSYAAFH